MGLFGGGRGEEPVEVHGDGSNGYVMVIGEEPDRKAREFGTAAAAIQHYNEHVKRDDGRAVIGSDDRVAERMARRPGNAAYGEDGWAVDVHGLGAHNLPYLAAEGTVDPAAVLEPAAEREMAAATPVDMDRELRMPDLMGYEVARQLAGGELYALARSSDGLDAPMVGPDTYLMRFREDGLESAWNGIMADAEERMADTIGAAATMAVCGALKEDESLPERVWNRRSLREIVRGDRREPRDFGFYRDLVQD